LKVLDHELGAVSLVFNGGMSNSSKDLLITTESLLGML
jgi:hypothetical protein